MKIINFQFEEEINKKKNPKKMVNPGRIYPRGGVGPPLERKNVAKQKGEKLGKSKTQPLVVRSTLQHVTKCSAEDETEDGDHNGGEEDEHLQSWGCP